MKQESHADYLIPTYNLSVGAEYVTTLRDAAENIDLWMIRAVRGVEYSSMEHSLSSQRMLYEQGGRQGMDPTEMSRGARKMRELYRRVHIPNIRHQPAVHLERTVSEILNTAGYDVNLDKALYLKIFTKGR